MPYGAPKKLIAVRLDPALVECVQALARAQKLSLTDSVEQSLRAWVIEKQRRPTPARRKLQQP